MDAKSARGMAGKTLKELKPSNKWLGGKSVTTGRAQADL